MCFHDTIKQGLWLTNTWLSAGQECAHHRCYLLQKHISMLHRSMNHSSAIFGEPSELFSSIVTRARYWSLPNPVDFLLIEAITKYLTKDQKETKYKYIGNNLGALTQLGNWWGNQTYNWVATCKLYQNEMANFLR